ncbi:MAG TPA: hypothetical protein VH186_35935 [Chloroflexia bacterium]|nr:hypothetical protein [Chloroflexia bacterium]
MHQKMMDNNSYNVIMALASNLEALEAYHKYAQDGNQQLWQQITRHTEEVVNLLKQELPRVMQGQSQQSYATQGGTSGQSSMGQSGMSGQSSMGQSGTSSQSGYNQGTQGNYNTGGTNPR